ncbi:MAG: hypothetical protein PHP01_00500 [Phycisphaerae bacterium]|nr:hypothetical protein [Phycisphaerae bacterium]
MKDIEHIEEMLNSYIDGELDERSSTEVKRLIDNDKEVFALYDSLKRYKSLMDTISQTPCPEGLHENITKQLERQILLADVDSYSHRAGKRHLIVRRLMTAAAIVVLGGILSLVVMDIFVPKSSRDKLISDAMGIKPIKQVLYEKPFPDEPPPQDKKVVQKKHYDLPLVAVLTLQTDKPIEVDWLVAKALNTVGLFKQTSSIERQTGSVRYVLKCSKTSLLNLLGELSFVWLQCANAKLDIGAEQTGKYVTVDNITAEQMMDICKADDSAVRLRMANDLAVINNTAAESVEKLYIADSLDYEKLLARKPAIASTEKIPDTNQPVDNSLTSTITILVVSK